jgi:hypothetical protein
MAFLSALEYPRPASDRIGLVLLARRELGMGQGYSPVIWPDWVPGVGNREITCFIADVTRRIDAPLNADEVDVGRVNRALFAVEEALVRRLVQIHDRAPDAQQRFFQEIRRRSDPGWPDILARAKAATDRVRTAQSYRPDVKSGESVVSRLWELSQKRSSRDLVTVAPALAAALDLPRTSLLEDRWDSLMTVLARLPERKSSVSEHFCHNAILTVSAACQYITCAAHAHEYQPFPVNLITSMVDDLYRSLTGVEMSVNHVSNDWAGSNHPVSAMLGDR